MTRPVEIRKLSSAVEGTAARLNTGVISVVVVATIPSFTRLWVSEKVPVPRRCPQFQFWHESVLYASLNAVRKLLQVEKHLRCDRSILSCVRRGTEESKPWVHERTVQSKMEGNERLSKSCQRRTTQAPELSGATSRYFGAWLAFSIMSESLPTPFR